MTTAIRLPQLTRVAGYPDGASRPVTCTALARRLQLAGLRQLVFRCGGFTDGTSGSPFLAHVSSRTGLGDVIGVLGGYQQGGDTAGVSYAALFGSNVAALLARAER